MDLYYCDLFMAWQRLLGWKRKGKGNRETMAWFCNCFGKSYEAPEVLELDYRHSSLTEVPPDVFTFERTLEKLCLASNQVNVIFNICFLSSSLGIYLYLCSHRHTLAGYISIYQIETEAAWYCILKGLWFSTKHEHEPPTVSTENHQISCMHISQFTYVWVIRTYDCFSPFPSNVNVNVKT